MKKNQHVQNVIFDLDRTLLDTEKIKDMLREIASAYGFTKKEEQTLYEKAVKHNGKMTFTFERYIEVLKNTHSRSSFKGERVARRTLKRLQKLREKLLLPGAKELLTICKKKNLKMFLLTLGAPQWQQQKIRWCGLKKYFRKQDMIFTETINTKEGKSESLKRVVGKTFDGSRSILFNDQPNQTDELLEGFPNMRALLRWEMRDKRVKREQFSRLQKKYPNRVFWRESLEELTRILKKILRNH